MTWCEFGRRRRSRRHPPKDRQEQNKREKNVRQV